MEQFRKWNDQDQILALNEKYLFAFSTDDGFSTRFLRAELVIDYDYQYILELRAFDHEKRTHNNSNSIIEKGRVTGNLLKLFENLLQSDYLALKHIYNYETFDITDIGMQQYLINLEPKTTSIYITDGLPAEYFKTKPEKTLFELNSFLKSWVEKKYNQWVKE